MKNTKLYLDYNATTPLDPLVLEDMLPYMTEHFGNPSSQQHPWGWTAEEAVYKARASIAKNLNCKFSEIFFTSGSTESNNWALFGLVQKWHQENNQEPIHILSTSIEHSSVKSALSALKTMAQSCNIPLEVELLPVDPWGILQPDVFKNAIRPSTKLLTIIWVNNEIGSIQPMTELCQIAKQNNIYIHTDATQAVGKLPIDLNKIPVDLMSFSGHKIYGPKGVGALYLRSQNPCVQILPFFCGGGQEQGLRSGTLNVPGIVGLARALDLCVQEHVTESVRLLELQKKLWFGLQKLPTKTQLNGPPVGHHNRSYVNLNLSFVDIPLTKILPHLMQLGISTGSACSSGSMKPSHVLLALGLSEEIAGRALRLSIGRWTSDTDIDQAIALLNQAVMKALGLNNSADNLLFK